MTWMSSVSEQISYVPHVTACDPLWFQPQFVVKIHFSQGKFIPPTTQGSPQPMREEINVSGTDPSEDNSGGTFHIVSQRVSGRIEPQLSRIVTSPGIHPIGFFFLLICLLFFFLPTFLLSEITLTTIQLCSPKVLIQGQFQETFKLICLHFTLRTLRSGKVDTSPKFPLLSNGDQG